MLRFVLQVGVNPSGCQDVSSVDVLRGCMVLGILTSCDLRFNVKIAYIYTYLYLQLYGSNCNDLTFGMLESFHLYFNHLNETIQKKKEISLLKNADKLKYDALVIY